MSKYISLRGQLVRSIVAASTALLLCGTAYAGLTDWVKEMTAEPPPRIIVVWVDMSGSITAQDWALYETSFSSIVKSLAPGDRLVLSTIKEDTLTAFHADADVLLDKTGNEFTDRDKGNKKRASLKTAFAGLQNTPRAKATNILDALNAADQLFVGATGFNHRKLVFFSDMVHETKGTNFAKTKVDGAFYEAVLKKRTDQQLVPRNLKGVDAYVVGAAGANAEKFAEVRSFWMKYFAVLGIQCSDAHYGRMVVSIE